MKEDLVYKDLVAVLQRRNVSPRDAAQVLLFLFNKVCSTSGVDTIAALRAAADDLEMKKRN